LGRNAEYEHRVEVGVYLEKEELEQLDEIRWREHKSKTQILRLAVLEYIKGHLNGNSTFKLDQWTDNPNFRAVPTIMADTDNWDKYLENCNPEELKDLQFRFSRCAEKIQELKK